ncbi:MAG: iron ABC transporter permease [Acidobacteria bacterium]|nr:iron ABC transporter permease [Acidobacteriota bacterium]
MAAGRSETDDRAARPTLARKIASPFRGRRYPPLVIVVPSIAAATLVSVPLVYVFVRAIARGWGVYTRALSSYDGAGLLLRTLLLVFGVAILSIAISVPMAWLVTRTDLPGRRLWALLGAVPLVFPSYIAAFTLVAVLGPRGYLQEAVARFGVEVLPELAYGYSGALLALALFSYPYLYLLLIASFRESDASLEEASRMLGYGAWPTFFRVVLPQARPALYGGTLLIILYTLSDFGAVSIVRYNTYTLAIYNAYRALFDRSIAASLATVLILLTVIFIVIEVALLRRVRPGPARPRPSLRTVRLGRWKAPSLVFLAILSILTVGIPIGTILHWGWRAIAYDRGAGDVVQPALNSVGSAGIAAIAAVLLAIAPAVWSSRYRGKIGVAMEKLAAAGFALPGIVIALALVVFSLSFIPWMYQTLTLLIAAYVIRFLPEAIAAARAAITAIPRELEEVARMLGRGTLGTIFTVTIPLMRRGILAGASLVFLTAMKELPATLILRPIGFETLATRIWTTASEGFYSETAAPALVLVLASALPVYWFVIRPVLSDGVERAGSRR